MKNIAFLLLFSCFLLVNPPFSGAEDFLGAPLIPGGKTIKKTDSRLEYHSGMTHQEALAFYKKALHASKDIKFRGWKHATYIEDDGKLKWHSITISKENDRDATVVIVKDNWTWIIGTLILRYIGVFVVLILLLLGMSLSGAIISRSVKKMEAKKEGAKP
ncbi:MAG: hypothetical protein GY849_10930 [Deltaproteobacteria bacterium]|nr:hypothetical protein [Deltaproteobacteria bacterium]